MSKILEVKNLSKIYHSEGEKLEILKDINFSLEKGENVALVGPSGCGKTTFLQIVGLLDQQNSGEIKLSGKNISELSESEKDKIRMKDLGFIYQFHHLMPEFTALENIMMPLLIAGESKEKAEKEAEKLLKLLDIENRASHRPNALSGGEKQRVAIARSLIHKPKLLLADEPTGNLDPKNANQVFKLFLDAIKSRNQSTIIVTHNPDLAKKLDKVITIEGGKIK